ncbi:TPA_asm: aminodeoxychorismate synthase component I, partial [Listeria monocytogenes]|nr:aminodeoxychorismate synthase component I [Listeria monocytogenes]
MQIKFNYRYYTDETEFETYACQFDHIVDQRVATQLADVGAVVDFAESAQRQGYYVALYLPYEAARYFN